MRLVLLTTNPDKPSTRVRLLRLVPWWQRAGFTPELAVIPRARAARAACWRTLAGAAVYLSRRLLGRGDLAELRRAARVLVYDFDDAVMYRENGRPSRRRRRRFARLCRVADLVVAANPVLAQAARAAGARTVHRCPSCVDLDDYPAVADAAPDATPTAAAGTSPAPVTLVWLGGRATLPYLHALLPALEPLVGELPGLVLRVVGPPPDVRTALTVEHWPWRPGDDAALLAGATLGLAPLPENPWTRGKSAFKVIQYGAAGLPVAAAPVGLQEEWLAAGARDHGASAIGWAARTSEDWRNAVCAAARDPADARARGAAHRRLVERCASWQSQFPALCAALQRQWAAR